MPIDALRTCAALPADVSAGARTCHYTGEAHLFCVCAICACAGSHYYIGKAHLFFFVYVCYLRVCRHLLLYW